MTFSGIQCEPDPVILENCQLKQQNARLLEELARLQDENRRLVELAETSPYKFGFDSIQGHREKDAVTNCLTGIPTFGVLLWLITMLSPLLTSRRRITIADQIVMTLMKLKLNLSNEVLAFLFGIGSATVSRTVGPCLQVMAGNLKFLIKWPSKMSVKKCLPGAFRGLYNNCRVIIDCSETFIVRSKNLLARALTYSNYKHHNTIKYLIGITPTGSISFVSKAWGGRTSDRVITENSGLYDLLRPGDQVLADRGFLIADDLAVRHCSLAIPAFTRGKKQLSRLEVEKSRKLARARIHVERAIRRVKVFKILSATMPISLLEYSNEILTVCCALTNLRPKLINPKSKKIK